MTGSEKMIEGHCHCGAVRLHANHAPKTLTECNCSICRRYGARWAYYTTNTAGVECDDEAVTAYAWSDRHIEFCHCSTCGCLTHYRSISTSNPNRLAINARMFEPDALEGIRIRHFDGASSWKYLDE